MMDSLLYITEAAIIGGIVVLVLGLGKLVFVPLAIAFEIRAAYAPQPTDADPRLVSVIVPAYNEGVVLENCIRSLLASNHRQLEIVIVDDGSTDNTAEVIRDLELLDSRITGISKPNAGKGAALNTGVGASTGDVLMFIDADGILLPRTIPELLRGLNGPKIGAACGDDHPVNLNRAQVQLLALLSHVGTGMVRRALTLLRCLPIVSGSIGAFPRSVVEEVGGLDETTVGEDLELTWRIRRAGYDVVFCPRALVLAESPSTLRALWRQRVRWARGLIQTTKLHRDMIGNPRYGPFGAYLVFNTLTMLVVPLLQLVLLVCVPVAIVAARPPFDYTVVAVVGWLGLSVSLALVLFAVVLNRAWRDLRFLWSLVLWPVYSTMLSVVLVAALWQERRGESAPWNKLTRTGDVSGDTARRLAGLAS